MEERLSMALLRLPPPLRAVVVLHDYQGLSHEEIARLTNVRHAAVRKRYSRALARLKDELKDLSG
jgi:RNA polymerase sigma factor (sigma-70 family)